jgi:pimeloyl-ACP methyl ester carboxylesterase
LFLRDAGHKLRPYADFPTLIETRSEDRTMPTFTTRDGVTLAYEDWGRGKPVLFVHAWALDSQMWAPHMLHFNARGMRTVAMDRRGHGRSDRPGGGYDYDRLADDLAQLIEHLDLRGVTLVGHSMGTAECIRLLTRHGSGRIAGMILLAPTAPCYLDFSGERLSAAVFEREIAAIHDDYPSWLADGADDFFLPEETDTSEGMIWWTISIMLNTSLHAATECFRTRVGIDMRAELPKVDVPTLVIHGLRDASEPAASGRAIADAIPGGRMLEYPDAPHGFYHTHKHALLKDMQAFIGDHNA